MVIIVPADALAPSGARPSADTVMTNHGGSYREKFDQSLKV